MTNGDYNAWDECPEIDGCGLIRSFLELVYLMVRDIQHLKAETIRARYELSKEYDPEQNGLQLLISFRIWTCHTMIIRHIRSTSGFTMTAETQCLSRNS